MGESGQHGLPEPIFPILMSLMNSKWVEWSRPTGEQQHGDRFALMRLVRYERGASLPPEQWAGADDRQDAGLMVNFSRGGLCLLTEQAPTVEEVLRVLVPGSVPVACSRTYAQVRWVRPLPFGDETIYAVGVQFVL